MQIPTRFVPGLFVLLWATGFIGARYAMPWAEPFSFLAVRFLLASAILAVMMVVLGSRKATWREAMNAAVAGGLMHGVYLGATFWAIHKGLPAGMSALVAGLQPLITAVLAGMLLGDRILPRHWIGLVLGFAGVVIVLLPKLGAMTGAITPQMLVASVFAVLGISSGTVWQKRFGAGGDMITGTFYQYAGAAAIMSVFSFALETQTFVLNGELIFALLWLVLVLSIGAIFLLMIMIRDGEMSRVSSVFYLVPAVTAVMAWFLFDESLTLVQIGGIALATFGVALATTRRPAEKTVAPAA